LETENTSLEITEDDIAGVEEQLEGQAVKLRKKKGRGNDIEEEEAPFALRQLSGKEVVDIFRFLHKQYLSWMREAEASKYTDIVRQIRAETMEETKKVYDYIINEYERRLEEYAQVIENLTKKIEEIAQKLAQQPQQAVQQAPSPVSILEDKRARAVLFAVMDSLLKNNPEYQQYRGLVAKALLGDIIEEVQKEQLAQAGQAGEG